MCRYGPTSGQQIFPATAAVRSDTLTTMNDDPFFPATVMPDRHWWAALWPNPMAVLRALGITPNMTVLDLCCGNGYFTAPLARLVAGQVYALDIDPTMNVIEELNRRQRIAYAKKLRGAFGQLALDTVKRRAIFDIENVAASLREPLAGVTLGTLEELADYGFAHR